MERLGEARIVRRLVTIRTGCRRTRKLRQVRSRLQIRDRAGMTDCTGTAVDAGDNLACMTACCTVAHYRNRRIIQTAGRVRRMVIVTMVLASLVCMTGGTGVARARGDNSGYRGGRSLLNSPVTPLYS